MSVQPQMPSVAVALSCAYILSLLFDFHEEASSRSVELNTAIDAVLITLPTEYLLGVVLVCLNVPRRRS